MRSHIERSKHSADEKRKAGPGAHAIIRVSGWTASVFLTKVRLGNSNKTGRVLLSVTKVLSKRKALGGRGVC